jgi:hypothetical protein
MAAVLDYDTIVEEVCFNWRNCSGCKLQLSWQLVISGEYKAVELACEWEAGAKRALILFQ